MLGGAFASINGRLPSKRSLMKLSVEPDGKQKFMYPSLGMYIRPKQIGATATTPILEGIPNPDIPLVARIAQGVPLASLCRRFSHESLEIRVTTHHTVQRNQVGIRQLLYELHKVPIHKFNSLVMPSTLRLCLCRF
jgi:hypothetical protein